MDRLAAASRCQRTRLNALRTTRSTFPSSEVVDPTQRVEDNAFHRCVPDSKPLQETQGLKTCI